MSSASTTPSAPAPAPAQQIPSTAADGGPLEAFHALLPADVARRVATTQKINDAVVVAVTQRGWTPAQLAREASRDLATAQNVGAVVTTRLVAAAVTPAPTGSGSIAAFVQPIAWCGRCSDEFARWADVEPGQPARRCRCWTDPRRAVRR
jgi:hypothetical protein